MWSKTPEVKPSSQSYNQPASAPLVSSRPSRACQGIRSHAGGWGYVQNQLGLEN